MTTREVDPLDLHRARRLALARAGLLRPERTGLPTRAAGRGRRARSAAHAVIERFGYLQLDSVSVVGARTHGLVLASRLDGFATDFAEELLQPGEPLFEYWGHEASWLPLDLYPTFGFRRAEYRVHPWWGDLLGEHSNLADEILQRVREEGTLRSLDLDDDGPGGWWGHGPAKKVVSGLWSAGELAVVERRGFQRVFDLAERVIPEALRRDQDEAEAFETLVLRALAGQGWATASTIARTWRLQGESRSRALAAIDRLEQRGEIVRCRLVAPERTVTGWIRPGDRELAEDLEKARPRQDRGVLLSPFDPVLWDRPRVLQLFGFEQVLEIYKPAKDRKYGYYCLPILAGDRLVGRVDLKAHRTSSSSANGGGRLEVRALHFEAERPSSIDREAVASALVRHAEATGLEIAAELRRLGLAKGSG